MWKRENEGAGLWRVSSERGVVVLERVRPRPRGKTLEELRADREVRAVKSRRGVLALLKRWSNKG